jgi:hypothetical protein
MKRPTRFVIVLTLVFIVSVRSAPAQESRAATIAEQQAKKAEALRPYEPGGLERALSRVENALINSPSGLHPFFGSVFTGGGFAIGPGYRQYYGDRTFWDAKGLFSIRGYKLGELSTDSLGHAHGRIDLFANVGWRDATRVPFYGLGNDSLKADVSGFDLRQTYATAGVRMRPSSWTILQSAISIENFRTANGRGGTRSTFEAFTPETAPGLGARPDYVHTMTTAGIDWRPAAGYARRGGLYALTYHNYADRKDLNSFDLLEAQLIQHVPILRENWVVSFRSQMQTALHDDDVVPYFLLPSLGSGGTLRGYASWRFRDRHSLLETLEWRWIPNRLGFDMALFVDAGKVAHRRSGLNFQGLRGDAGIGARFHGPAATMLRIEMARGTEGTRLVFSGGAAF